MILNNENDKATIALVLGICSLYSWIVPEIGIVNSIVGLVFSSISLKTKGKVRAISGLILNIVGAILSVSSYIIGIIFHFWLKIFFFLYIIWIYEQLFIKDRS